MAGQTVKGQLLTRVRIRPGWVALERIKRRESVSAIAEKAEEEEKVAMADRGAEESNLNSELTLKLVYGHVYIDP